MKNLSEISSALVMFCSFVLRHNLHGWELGLFP